MRILIAALAFVLVLGSATMAMAQSHGSSGSDARSPAVTIDLASVGGGLIGLVAASGLVNIYTAGSMIAQGTPFVEALEAGAGLPLLASAVAVIVGGLYARDIVTNEILPLFNGK